MRFYICFFFVIPSTKTFTNSDKWCIFSILLSKQLSLTQTYNRQITTLLRILISLTSSSQSLSWVISPSLYVFFPILFYVTQPRLDYWYLPQILLPLANFCTSDFDPCIYFHQHIPSHSSSSQLKYNAVLWLPSYIGKDI